MKDYDVNVTPLEYAESIRKQVLEISPSRLFTYRYVWKRDDKDSLSIMLYSGTLSDHENFRNSIITDEHVLSATSEYISECDGNYMLLVEPIKKELNKTEVSK